jgi:Xaa-Pro dipeptidase
MRRKGFDALIVSTYWDVRYLSGYNSIIGMCVVLLPLEGEPFLLIDQYWDLERARSESAFPNVSATSSVAEGIVQFLAKSKTGRVGIVGWRNFPVPIYLQLVKQSPQIKFEDATSLLQNVRMIKSDLEMSFLRRAAKISDAGAIAASRAIKVDVTERQIAIAAERAMKEAGAESLSFPTVLGSGKRTQLIVPMPTEKKVKRGEIVLMDLGGKFRGYCGDISRTKKLGVLDQKQRELYVAVMEMHKQAIKMVRPGVKANQVHNEAVSVAREYGFSDYVKHLTGHALGLEEHEWPIIEHEEVELVSGMVITIEPGLYAPKIGGIRVEDMVSITDSGTRILTTADREL